MVSQHRSGLEFVVWKPDRVEQSLAHRIELLKRLQERDIKFISLTEQIDTTTPGRKLISHILDAHCTPASWKAFSSTSFILSMLARCQR
ncbi:recombinase family protein [Dictyobacter vulcani]|uniref:recombinase family protein n=1 Tax=Dictyobacter vulcani TaxID=2607529 RepID=UPI0012505A9B|nr:recombinase family protein [Dictyobacter vulcani]